MHRPIINLNFDDWVMLIIPNEAIKKAMKSEIKSGEKNQITGMWREETAATCKKLLCAVLWVYL